MINKLIKAQLDNLQEAHVEEYDTLHHTFHIKKHKAQEFNYGVKYLVRLDETLLKPSVNDVLVSNWNNGKRPTHPYLEFAITKKLAGMLFVFGYYYDEQTNQSINEEFEDWLPEDRIKVIRETKL